MKNKNFIVLAKIDHILFKADALENVQKNNNKAFETHDSCRFGQWYNSDGKSQFGHAPSFDKMIVPHAMVHNSVIDTFELLKNGSVNAFEDEIKNNFINMEKSSKVLFELMDNILAEEANYASKQS